jgi:lactate racemase
MDAGRARSTVRVELPYAAPELSACEIPADRLSAIYRMAEPPIVPDLPCEISAALASPFGAPRLARLAAGRGRIAVLVDDMTRPTPAARILPVVLEELCRAGVRREQVTIVLALGSHRRMSPEEIRAKVGAGIVADYPVLNSRFDDPAHLDYLGTSDDGVPIWIDEVVARADLRVGIGGIVPHGAVGWSGGGKLLYPGVAGQETVARFHFAHGVTEENMTGREDCPIRLRMERWVDRVGLEFIVNCVLTPDDRVFRVVAGHYRDAQRAGVVLAKEIYSRRIQERVDIVVSAAYAHDLDFWQAAKGIYGPEALLRDGGTLLLVAPCPEGSGPHPAFLERIGRDDNREILLGILGGQAPPPDPISLAPAAMMAKMRRRFRCAAVSPGLSAPQLAQAGYEKFDDVQSGLETLLARYPQGRVAVVLRSDLTFF